MRTQEKGGGERDTHILERASGKTSETTKRKRTRAGHSLPGDHIERVKSGHGKKLSTHLLQSVLGGRSEETERERASKGHVRTGGRVGRNKAGHGKRARRSQWSRGTNFRKIMTQST
jgi:hypothetical protein